jgi:hypothetical protein
MKIGSALFAILLAAALAAPTFARDAPPNPQAEAEWQRYLAHHPGLREHPEWLLNPKYMQDHPNMAKWLHEHPRVLEDAREQGMWDRDGRWHDADWWRDHHPQSLYEYHPEWAETHPNWRGRNDGDWDDQHHWHFRNWWMHERKEWAQEHHPEWFREHESDKD